MKTLLSITVILTLAMPSCAMPRAVVAFDPQGGIQVLRGVTTIEGGVVKVTP